MLIFAGASSPAAPGVTPAEADEPGIAYAAVFMLGGAVAL